MKYIIDEFGIGQTIDWFNEDHHRTMIDEQNGRLYFHWVHLKYDPQSILFEDYTDDKPRTIEQLKTWLAEGNYLYTNWGDRASVGVAIYRHHSSQWFTSSKLYRIKYDQKYNMLDVNSWEPGMSITYYHDDDDNPTLKVVKTPNGQRDMVYGIDLDYKNIHFEIPIPKEANIF